ncbi:hypothetical protein FMUND_13361 [Fusarium mundagurra]|uniref:Uncharacterized protein n=1 Tax=Fusarium mundagurra TaxID=1567541 RepID=A0A8H6D369_9HYPO|nr:hypothetical protein FMUND_13361 [Fusarium mundagurra]
MHDRFSYTQLYIAVVRCSAHEGLDLPPDEFFFEICNFWSIVVHDPYHWPMQQGLLVDGDPCRNVTGDQATRECPEQQTQYFEVASFKRDRLEEEVNHIIRSIDPKDADDTLECNREWVRDIFKKLVAGRIVSRKKADNILFELGISSKEIEPH